MQLQQEKMRKRRLLSYGDACNHYVVEVNNYCTIIRVMSKWWCSCLLLTVLSSTLQQFLPVHDKIVSVNIKLWSFLPLVQSFHYTRLNNPTSISFVPKDCQKRKQKLFYITEMVNDDENEYSIAEDTYIRGVIHTFNNIAHIYDNTTASRRRRQEWRKIQRTKKEKQWKMQNYNFQNNAIAKTQESSSLTSLDTILTNDSTDSIGTYEIDNNLVCTVDESNSNTLECEDRITWSNSNDDDDDDNDVSNKKLIMRNERASTHFTNYNYHINNDDSKSIIIADGSYLDATFISNVSARSSPIEVKESKLFLEDQTKHEINPPYSTNLPFVKRYRSKVNKFPQTNETYWLEQSTQDMIDLSRYPMGTLGEDDIEVICNLMASWPRRKSVYAAMQVELLLKRIIEDMKHGNPNAYVTSRMYTYAIDAWAKSGAPGSARRAQSIHDAMVSTYKETNDPLLSPSVVSYNALINAWGKCHRSDSYEAIDRAEQVLTDMLDAMYRKDSNTAVHQKDTTISTESTSSSQNTIPSTDAVTTLSTSSSTTKSAPVEDINITFPLTERIVGPMQIDSLNVDKDRQEVMVINIQRNDHGDGSVSDIDDDYGGTSFSWNELKPDAITFATLLDTYARQQQPLYTRDGGGATSNLDSHQDKNKNIGRGVAAVKRCEELFDLMDRLNIKKNSYTYSALQNVYARSSLSDSAQRTRDVLDRMLSLYQQGNVYAKPNTINYNAVLNSLSRAPSKENAKQAIDMLSKMELHVDEGGYDVEPDRLSYAVTILACTRCPDVVFAAKTAEQTLLRMEMRARQEATRRRQVSSAAPPSVTLDVECFNVVLTAISRCRQRDAPDRAMRLIQRMEQYARDGQEAVRPNIRSWNAVLNAFARATEYGDKQDFAQRAESILDRLVSMNNEGIPNCKPDAFTYAAVLSAYQKSYDPNAAHCADRIVRKMEQQFESGESDTPADTYHYTILCGTWAKSNNEIAAKRVLQILLHMTDRERAGHPNVKPNTRTFNAVLDCLSRSGEEDRAEQLLFYMLKKFNEGDNDAKPDSFSFNCVIQAFTKSSKKGAGKRAEAVLDRFFAYHEAGADSRPDSRSFSHIINYYTRKCQDYDAMHSANNVLTCMINRFISGQQDLAPKPFLVTAVMDCYSWHAHPDSGVTADRLLHLLQQLIQDYGVCKLVVNTSVMNSVLFAWSSCGDENAAKIAESYLDEMEDAYESGNVHLQPDSRSYGLVLSAWSKSNSSDKAPRALRVLQRMERQCEIGNTKVSVDEHAYSLVINTCAFSNSGPEAEEEAFAIAVTVMNKVLSSTDQMPTSLTFGWFIQACGRLRVSEEQKSVQITKAFMACCEAGLVNDFVWQRLNGAASDCLHRTLMQSVALPRPNYRYCVKISDLPNEWTRNTNVKRHNKRKS